MDEDLKMKVLAAFALVLDGLFRLQIPIYHEEFRLALHALVKIVDIGDPTKLSEDTIDTVVDEVLFAHADHEKAAA